MKYILLDNLKIKDLSKIYNREREKLLKRVQKLAKERVKALKYRYIKNEGFDIIRTSMRSEYGDWSYNLIIRLFSDDHLYQIYTVINDQSRLRKKTVILWGILTKDSLDSSGFRFTHVMIKQHALERYYERSLKEDFPGIEQAIERFLINEVLIDPGDNDGIDIVTSVDRDRNICLGLKSGQLLAYSTKEMGFDPENPIVYNTFVSDFEINAQNRKNQLETRKCSLLLQQVT